MIEQMAFTVLGALLASFGGVLTTLWVDYRSELRKEEAVLTEVRALLHATIGCLSCPVGNEDEMYTCPGLGLSECLDEYQLSTRESPFQESVTKLNYLAKQLKTKRNMDIAMFLCDLDATNTSYSVLACYNEVCWRLNSRFMRALGASPGEFKKLMKGDRL